MNKSTTKSQQSNKSKAVKHGSSKKKYKFKLPPLPHEDSDHKMTLEEQLEYRLSKPDLCERDIVLIKLKYRNDKLVDKRRSEK